MGGVKIKVVSVLDDRYANLEVDGVSHWVPWVTVDDEGGTVRVRGVMYRVCGCSVYPLA